MIVGLDMGGTHIDAVIIDKGTIINTVKKPIDSNNPFESILITLNKLLAEYPISKIKRINLSTTTSTNAIVEGNTAPVGMIIQSGPGLPHDFLACGDENLFISGYIDHRGKSVKEVYPNEIDEAKRLFKDKGIDSCAIVTKFSTRNFEHELRIKELLKCDFSAITMGHTLSGNLNFPRRVYTAYLNGATYHIFKEFSNSIEKSMEEKAMKYIPLYILKADGGTITLPEAQERPVETILSGPAASFMGLNALLPSKEDAILLDIGGTTTDMFFLVDGVPLFEPLGIEIGDHKTLVRAIYSRSIGLGGDSSIKVRDGKPIIGPNREGPPYALGGPVPTPSDAMIVLGLMDIGNMDKARKAMAMLPFKPDMSIEDRANKILETMGDMVVTEVDNELDRINSRPVYTIEELLHGKRIVPKRVNIIGGPAKALKPTLEEKFQLPTYFPGNYHVANAIGAALAKVTTEINLMADTSSGILSVPELGVHERITRGFSLDCARKRAIALLKERALQYGAEDERIETEIVEESCFNVVKGFFTGGQNIRIKAQIKPGLALDLNENTETEGGKND